MRIPDFRDRLTAGGDEKKTEIKRARAIAADRERLKRIEARPEIIAARNIRIAKRERVRCEATAHEAGERGAVEAAKAAAPETARKVAEENAGSG